MSTPVDTARAAYYAARDNVDAQRAVVDAAAQTLALYQRQLPSDDPKIASAAAYLASTQTLLTNYRAAQASAKAALASALSTFLGTTPENEFVALDGDYPVALFPVRIETRFHRPTSASVPDKLQVRIYPDEILAHSHEPALTDDEWTAGTTFWTNVLADSNKKMDEWRRIVGLYPSTRAAWIVRATQPDGAGNPPPRGASRTHAWTRAVEAKLLPDRWVVVGYRGTTEMFRAFGSAIQEPLAVTDTPDSDAPTTTFGGRTIGDDVLWTYDFTRALSVGMALEVSLASVANPEQGFDRVVVLGVKASMGTDEGGLALADLLDGHHYTRGLALVPQGTAAHNTSDGPSGFPATERDSAVTYGIERADKTPVDGARLAAAFGVDPSVMTHVEYTDSVQDDNARYMIEALWPATFGYFLEQMMAPSSSTPLFTQQDIADARAYVLDAVRGRGSFSAFRVGGTPYGLLPALSLSQWQPDDQATGADAGLPAALLGARTTWANAVPGVPRVGATQDADADLLGILGMDGAAREIRQRYVFGPDAVANGAAFLGTDANYWLDHVRDFARPALQAIGHDGWEPRAARTVVDDAAARFDGPLVAPATIPKDQRLDAIGGDKPNYIAAIRSATVDDLWSAPYYTDSSKPLLHHLLRHAVLVEYARVGFNILVTDTPTLESLRREPELVDLTDPALPARGSTRNLLLQTSSTSGSQSLQDYLQMTTSRPDAGELQNTSQALDALSKLPIGELERLMLETLDLCSYRLDAWITSLATRRLSAMRETKASGCSVGAFGWVEDLRPVPAPTTHSIGGIDVILPVNNGGFIHAPSHDQAAAAAVLRSAYLTRQQDGQDTYALALSSQRVRLALELLDEVRQGQPLGAVLGYRFERGLHDAGQNAPIYLFRGLYPLVANKSGAEPTQPAESIAARNVVDGLALRLARMAIPPGGDFFAKPELSSLTSEEKTAVTTVLNALDASIDALSDVLSAEAVFQLLRGNPSNAAASLDTLARGARPADPEIVKTTRSGPIVTYRVGLLLSDARPSPEHWIPAPPPAPQPPDSARALAEPALDNWASQVLGDPAMTKCRVNLANPGQPSATLAEVTLADLQIRALDFLAIARQAPSSGSVAELDRRVADAARRLHPGATVNQIVYDADPSWSRTTTRTFPELLQLAHEANEVLSHARALTPDDLGQPKDAQSLPQTPAYDALTQQRASEAVGRLTAACVALEAALAPLRPDANGAIDTTIDAGGLLGALRAVAAFGIGGAYPDGALDGLPGERASLLQRAEAVLKEANARSLSGTAATDPIEQAKAVFGGDFLFVAPFVPGNAGELLQTPPANLLGGDADAPRKWFQSVARVRPPLAQWRRFELFAGALGGVPADIEVLQLPYDSGARWVALPFITPLPPDTVVAPIPAGAVAFEFLCPFALPHPGQTWTGLWLDSWTEIVPNVQEVTSLAFHYDDPGAEAPQTILLAVPPNTKNGWNLDALIATVGETLDLAKIRAVDNELLGPMRQFLPAVYLSQSSKDQTIRTDLHDQLVSEEPS